MRILRFAVPAVIVLAFAWYIYLRLFPKTLGDYARDALVDSWTGRWDRLYGLTSSGERQALDWSPNKLQQCYDYVVKPSYAGLSGFQVGPASVHTAMGVPHEGVCKAFVTTSSGKKIGIPSIVETTDEGPITSPIVFVLHSWFVRYHELHPEAPWNPYSAAEGQLEGYRKYKEQLRMIGIKGIVSVAKPGKLIPWDDWYRSTATYVASAKPGETLQLVN